MPEDGHLHGKYEVARADGQYYPESRYFVLDYTRDPHAAAAMALYADLCAEEMPTLVADIRAVLHRSWPDGVPSPQTASST